MANTSILEVQRLEVPSDLITAFSIDEPTPGMQTNRLTVDIAGWVVGNAQPVREVQVWIEGLGLAIQRIRVGAPRPDVAAYLPDIAHAGHSGFYGQFSTLGLAPKFRVILQAVTDEQQLIPFAVIHATREGSLTAQAADSTQLQPLLVTALARSGTTWLMHMLSKHPAICIFPGYPYEMHAAAYWWHMCRVLTAPASDIGVSHPDYFWLSLEHIGPHPSFTRDVERHAWLREWFQRDHLDRAVAHAKNTIEHFYRCLAANRPGLQARDARYFAEKMVIPYYGWLVWELYPGAREIFLVRDFRDVYCSILAFNRKRGIVSFGRETVQTDEDYAAWLNERATALRQNWEARAGRAMLLRYEDLVRSPEGEGERLLKYLGLDHSRASVRALIENADPLPEMQQHRTTSDVLRSIGRWQHDLSPSLQAVVNDVFRDNLEAFGYTT